MEASIIRDLQESYESIYHYDEVSLFGDIVNFCIEANIFNNYDEAGYFAEEVIAGDLISVFFEDIQQFYYDAENEYLTEEYALDEGKADLVLRALNAVGGLLKKAPAAAKGMSSKTLLKKGFRPTDVTSKGQLMVGKGGAPVPKLKNALQTSTREVRAARDARRAANPPSSELPGTRLRDLQVQRANRAANAYPASTRARMGAPEVGPGTMNRGTINTAPTAGAFPVRAGAAAPRGAAISSTIRASRKAAAGTVPNETAGKYLNMLNAKRATSGGAIVPSPRGLLSTRSPGRPSNQPSFIERGWERHRAAGGPDPKYIATRAGTDTAATALATMLGMQAHMAGIANPLSKAIQAASPAITRTATQATRTAPRVTRMADPWKIPTAAKPRASAPAATPKPSMQGQLPGVESPRALLPSKSSGSSATLYKGGRGGGGGGSTTPKALPGSKGGALATTEPAGALVAPTRTPRASSPRQLSGGSAETVRALPPARETIPRVRSPKDPNRFPSELLPKGRGGALALRTPSTTGGAGGAGGSGGAGGRTPYRHVSSRGSGPFRATGPSGGNPTLERLASQAARPQRGGGKPDNNDALAAAAAIAGLGALGVGLASKKKEQKYDVYNTKDPNGRIRSRLKVGPKIVGPKIVGPRIVGDTFNDAFREARRKGLKTFKYGDGEYTTELATEEVYYTIVNHLLSEGYASDEQTAQQIINAMGDEWLDSIINEGAAELLYSIFGPVKPTPEQRQRDIAGLREIGGKIRNAASGVTRAIVGPGPRANQSELNKKRLPQTPIQKDVAARTARTLGQ